MALDGSGEVWSAPNPKVRVQANWTMGRSVERQEPAANVEPLRPAAAAAAV